MITILYQRENKEPTFYLREKLKKNPKKLTFSTLIFKVYTLLTSIYLSSSSQKITR